MLVPSVSVVAPTCRLRRQAHFGASLNLQVWEELVSSRGSRGSSKAQHSEDAARNPRCMPRTINEFGGDFTAVISNSPKLPAWPVRGDFHRDHENRGSCLHAPTELCSLLQLHSALTRSHIQGAQPFALRQNIKPKEFSVEVGRASYFLNNECYFQYSAECRTALSIVSGIGTVEHPSNLLLANMSPN